jgi:hypothetical protein
MKAFPRDLGSDQQGMDLRDYFAAKAMQGMMGAAFKENVTRDRVAEVAYKMADSMMIARQKK